MHSSSTPVPEALAPPITATQRRAKPPACLRPQRGNNPSNPQTIRIARNQTHNPLPRTCTQPQPYRKSGAPHPNPSLEPTPTRPPPANANAGAPEDFFPRAARSQTNAEIVYPVARSCIKRTSTLPHIPSTPLLPSHPHSLPSSSLSLYTRSPASPPRLAVHTSSPNAKVTQKHRKSKMLARLSARAPRAFNAAAVRFNSSAARTSRLAEMAASAEKPGTPPSSLSF
jgi:hypothetical protein